MTDRKKPLAEYPELMTVTETAEYLRIAPSTCYLLTKRSEPERTFPSTKVGGRTFVLRDRIPDYLDSNQT